MEVWKHLRAINWPRLLLGSLMAAGATALLNFFVLTPLLGPGLAKRINTFILFFLVGYLVLPFLGGERHPKLLWGRPRVISALLFAAIGGSLSLVLDWLWPT